MNKNEPPAETGSDLLGKLLKLLKESKAKPLEGKFVLNEQDLLKLSRDQAIRSWQHGIKHRPPFDTGEMRNGFFTESASENIPVNPLLDRIYGMDVIISPHVEPGYAYFIEKGTPPSPKFDRIP